jgi:hypothetical protein
MKNSTKTFAVALVGLALNGMALAQFPYSTSFESPTFASGSALSGQGGWISGSAWTVVNGVSRTGSQSVQWTNSGGASGVDAFVDFGGINQVMASVFVQISSNSDAGYYFGLRPFFDTSFAEFADVVVNKNGDVRATTGSSSNSAVNTVANVGNIADQWVEVKLTIDLVSNQVMGSVHGTSFALPDVTLANSIFDLDLYSRPISPTAGTFGTAFFDDYSAEAVPEPATLAVLAAGALAMSRRRKK